MATRHAHREKIVRAVLTALGRPARPQGLTAHRSRARPIWKDQLPAALAYLIDEAVEVATHDGDLERTLKLRVELRVQGDDSDEKLDPLIRWTEETLLRDPDLAQLITRIEPRRIRWAAAGGKGGAVFGAAGFDFEISYFTVAGYPEEVPS